jgi:putative transposase
VLRKRWNTVTDDVCVNAETGQLWWPECSKGAYADGIAGAVDAYWNWQISRASDRGGKPMGFPGSRRKDATPTACRSPPARCASNPTGGI